MRRIFDGSISWREHVENIHRERAHSSKKLSRRAVVVRIAPRPRRHAVEHGLAYVFDALVADLGGEG